MKNLLTIIIALALPAGAQAADCYSDSLMTYVESRQLNAKTDRWVRIEKALREEEGAMPLSEAEQILANRKRMRLFLEHMDEVVAAIKCLAAEPEAQVVVEETPPPQPAAPAVPNTAPPPAWPDPKPQEDAQDQSPTLTENFKVYWHGGTMAPSNVDWRISEDDKWESEVIVQFELPNVQTSDSNTVFCVSGGVWTGADYRHRGQFRMSGITTFAEEYSGQYACTNPLDSSDVLSRESITGGNRFTYRGTITTRDNNVIEKDLDVGKLVFTYGAPGNRQSYGRTNQTPTTHHIPSTDMVADREAYRLKRDEPVWPSRNGWCLGDGSSWTWKVGPTCEFVSNSRWLDRAPSIGNSCNAGKQDADYLVRANATAEQWLPDHCYPTKEVLSDPVTSATTFVHSENRLPVIEDDEVAYLNVRKRGGKWTYSNSKLIVQQEIKGRPAACSNWGQRKDYVYLELRKGPALYVELPAGDVSDYDMSKAKIATGCSDGDIQYYDRGATLSDICVGTIDRQRLNGVILDSIWIGDWGEVKKSNNDQIVFEQAGTIVNLCPTSSPPVEPTKRSDHATATFPLQMICRNWYIGHGSTGQVTPNTFTQAGWEPLTITGADPIQDADGSFVTPFHPRSCNYDTHTSWEALGPQTAQVKCTVGEAMTTSGTTHEWTKMMIDDVIGPHYRAGCYQ